MTILKIYRYGTLVLVTLLAVLVSLAVPQTTRAQFQNGIEGGFRFDQLSGDFTPWKNVYVRGFSHTSEKDYWSGEAHFANKLGENGFLYSLSYRRVLNAKWFGVSSLTTSSGGFFHPKYRADVQIARKLARQKVIALVGGGINRAKDEHRDTYVSLEGVYYGPQNLVFQSGVRLNVSNPGKAFSRYHNSSITKFKPNDYQVGVTFGFGNESYEIIEPLVIFTDFKSWNSSITARKWFANGWGVNASVSYYQSDFYNRRGVSVGVFREF